jgi:hypothetical protein
LLFFSSTFYDVLIFLGYITFKCRIIYKWRIKKKRIGRIAGRVTVLELPWGEGGGNEEDNEKIQSGYKVPLKAIEYSPARIQLFVGMVTKITNAYKF